MVRLSRSVATAALWLVAAAALAGCSATVDLDPAEGSDDPACAEVTVRLPGSVAEQPRRWTDAQATGAWGASDSSVLLRCGVAPPGPTDAGCITLGGVDWVVDESQAPKYLVTSYGRVPAVEVFIDNASVSSNDVLSQLGVVVAAATTQERACTVSQTPAPEG